MNILVDRQVTLQLPGGRSYASAADKFNDPNRLTWDEFKKLHGDEMEFRQDQAKDTEKYRKQLDADRDQRLKHAARAKRKRQEARARGREAAEAAGSGAAASM